MEREKKISAAGKEELSPQLLNAVPSSNETLTLATPRSVEACKIETGRRGEITTSQKLRFDD
jgi:hypothetical protein